MKKLHFLNFLCLSLLFAACGPFTSERVSIPVNDEVTPAGTLSIPHGEGPFHGVILISGSGLQTRDSNLWGFEVYKETARHLASMVDARSDDVEFTILVAALNAPALEKTFEAMGKADYEIQVLEDANHLFQQAETGAVSEYPELPKEFVPGYLQTITEWVLRPGSAGGA